MNLRAVRWRLLVGVAIGVGGAVAVAGVYEVEAWHGVAGHGAAGHGGAGHGAAGSQPLIVPLRRTANDAIGAP